MSSIGVDIGASHISCGLYDSKYEKLESKIYLPNTMNKNTNINISTKNLVTIVINLLDRLIKQNNASIGKITSIGLGCPGGIDKSNGIFLGSSTLMLEK